MALLLLPLPALGATVPLIIDTDIGGGSCRDVDDVGAICMAHALADNGEVDLLAIIQNSRPLQSTGVISVLNHFYGRDQVLIGAFKHPSSFYSESKSGAKRGIQYLRPWDQPGVPPDPLPYVVDLVANWPSPFKNSSQVDSAVSVYRRVLAAQPDSSVVISSIG